MTDINMGAEGVPAKGHSLTDTTPLVRRRKAAEKRFQAYGIAAIACGLFFLVVLLTAIVSSGTGEDTTKAPPPEALHVHETDPLEVTEDVVMALSDEEDAEALHAMLLSVRRVILSLITTGRKQSALRCTWESRGERREGEREKRERVLETRRRRERTGGRGGGGGGR